MVPMRSDLVGQWSENFGYEADLSRDSRIELCEDGTGCVIDPGERIELLWETPAPGKLVLMVNGNRMGPFEVRIKKEQLPLGEHEVLESSGGLLAFDRRRFTRLQ